MKKLAIGCGVLMFIGIVTMGIGARMLWNKTVGGIAKLGKQIEQVNEKHAFSETPDMLVEGVRLDQWFAIVTPLVEEYAISLKRIEDLTLEFGDSGSSGAATDLGILDMFRATQSLFTELVRPMEDALAKLDEAEMSVDEMLWIWGQFSGVIEQADLSKYPEWEEAFEQYRERLAMLEEGVDTNGEDNEMGQVVENSIRTEMDVSETQKGSLMKLLEQREDKLERFFGAINGLLKQMDTSDIGSGGDGFGDPGFGNDPGFGDPGFDAGPVFSDDTGFDGNTGFDAQQEQELPEQIESGRVE